MNPWLYYLLAVLMLLAAGSCWLTNLFGIPGNWLLLVVVGLFAWLVDGGDRGVGLKTMAVLLALAVVGEVVEFVAGAAGAAKQGASRKAKVMAVVGAMIGSIAGAMMGMPVPLIGSMAAAVLGGAAGAFVGAYWGEQQSERGHSASLAVGKGAFIGRLWGTAGKLIVGAIMLAIAALDALLL